MTRPVRFGIVGAGVSAGFHASAIASTLGATLAAVCRADSSRSAEAAVRFGVPCESSYKALLARTDIDVVCVCTPSGLHAGHAIAAARAGKHVLLDKPMALTLEDADAAIAACREAGVLLSVALQRRTDPAIAALRSAITCGTLGRLVLGTVSIPYLRTQSYFDSAAWRGTWALDGGGVLINQGIHLVDILLWLMGDVAQVRAEVATLAHQIEVEDCLTASLVFENGALGSIAATSAAGPGFPHRVEVYGTDGGAQIEGESIVRWETNSEAGPIAATASLMPIAAGAGASPTGISLEGHARQIADVVAAVREGRAPLVTGEEGRRSLALIVAAYASARTGRPVQPG